MSFNIIDSDKYVDFFGWGDDAGKKNMIINQMLDEIESLYYNPSMIGIGQVMVHAIGCSVCEQSMPIWENMTDALERRFHGKYFHMTLEINQTVDIDGMKFSGGSLYNRYDAKGAPFFLQNFKIAVLRKTKSYSKAILQIRQTEWFKVTEGLLQPFEFLSTCFNIKNRFMENKITGTGMYPSPF